MYIIISSESGEEKLNCPHLSWSTVTGEMYICDHCGLGRQNAPLIIDAEFEVIEEE